MAEPRAAEVELRLALAMRGGVSLAVWIGGACCEIDALRVAADAPADGAGDHFWTPWLRRAGYQRVVVDVLSGASAGGLNGVLYAASQVYGFPYAAMRQVWLELGSTESLVRREEPYQSLFLGDDYFQRQVTEQMAALIAAVPAPPASPPAVDLSLSVTYVEPIERPVPSPSDQTLTERRFASGFVFRHPPGDQPWRATDFPTTTDGRRFAEAIGRLGLAGRATSSFPGAFEAAVIRAARPEVFGGRPAAAPSPDAILDMGGVLLDRAETPMPGTDERPVFVTDDGGILDNIPIGRALDAVAAAPADGRTDRLVIYLQPGGTGSAHHKPAQAAAVTAPVPLATRRNTVSVLRGMAKSRLGDETINADIAQLEAQNAAIERATVIRHGTYADIDTPEELVKAARRQWPSYVLSRGMEDAHRIVRLLSDPIDVLQRDPFPRTLAGQVVSDDRWRSPLATWPTGEREALSGALTRVLTTKPATTFGKAFTVGVRPLLRVCGLLIEVARLLEAAETATAENRTTASRIKSDLYRTRAIIDQLLDEPRRLMWVAAAVGQREPDADVLATTSPALVDALCWWAPDDVAAITRACRADPGADIGALPATAMARIDELVRTRATSTTGRDDLRDALLDDIVVPLALELVALPWSAAPAPDAGDEPIAPAALLRRVLPAGDAGDMARALGALEVLSLGEFMDGTPGRKPVRYVRMSSENRTPLAPAFTRVLDVATRDDLWWGDSRVPAEQEGIHVQLKLAGNELANFAAFLLPEWRANDWLWGQLDAVPTMIDQLVSVGAVRALLAEHDGDVDGALAELLPATHPWHHPPFAGSGRVEAVGAELADVAAGRSDAVPAIRDALIAARQWQILAVDLALTWNPGEAPPDGPVDVARELATRRFGSETIRDNDRKDQLRDRFDELATAVGETLIWNVNNSKLPGGGLPPRRAKLVRRIVGILAPTAIGRILGTTPGSSRSWPLRALIALGALALIGAAVAGLVRDRLAFALGVVVALSVLAIPAIIVKRWLDALAKERQPRT